MAFLWKGHSFDIVEQADNATQATASSARRVFMGGKHNTRPRGPAARALTQAGDSAGNCGEGHIAGGQRLP
jgi:hypothetical protein